MIIASIGSTKLVIETLKDAEALLDIFNRSTLVEQSFDVEARDVYYTSEGEKRICIEITEGSKIISLAEFREIRAAREARTAAAVAKQKSGSAA